MDCKTASELIMKYLDKDITKEQEMMLLKHTAVCESCSLEFETLRDACLMLEDAEFEEPPADIERNVIMSIKSEDALTACRIGVVAFIIIVAGWIGLTNFFLHTPVVSILKDSFDSFLWLINSVGEIVSSTWGVVFSGSVRLFALARALKTVQMAILDMYNVFIMAMILSAAIIFVLYGYTLKTFRR